MDGSMRYATGGRGIFDHLDGPYAGPPPSYEVAVMGAGRVPGAGGAFGALGQDGVEPVPSAESSVDRATADLVRNMLDGKLVMGPGEKMTIEEAIQAAGQWAEESQAWYRKPKVWAWIICGSAVVVGGVIVWKKTSRRAA